MNTSIIRPYVEIVEQPASKEFRFRYECERRSHGSIPGVRSTHARKTYPTIKIVGLDTRAHIIVSCVTKDTPYRVHPHRLISKENGANYGVFATTADPMNNEVELKNIGIQCVRKRDIQKSLNERQRVRVDPFHQGYDYLDNPTIIDLSVVRLCFQVFLFDRETGKYTRKLPPVVSDPIYDRQTTSNLSISKLSTEVASAAGGTPLTIFGQKIIKQDIKVRFFEMHEDKVVWEASEDLLPRNNNDDQTVITIKTPAYRLEDTEDPVHVMVQLTKPSTGEAGKAIPFTFLCPSYFEQEIVNTPMDLSSKRKRPVVESYESCAPSNMSVSAPNLAPNPPRFNFLPEPMAECFPCQPAIGHPDTHEYLQSHRNPNLQVVPIHQVKKPKHLEGPIFPIAPRLQPRPTMYPPFLMNSPVNPVMYNNSAYDCQCYPLPPYHPFLPFVHQSTPYVYQHPFFGSTLPKIRDRPEVSFNNQRLWNVQPEPILSPIVVKVSEKEIEPPISFDFNTTDQLHVSRNLMDLDLDRYICSLSDSFSNIKLNGKDSITFCDNQQGSPVQLEPILEPNIVQLSHEEVRSLTDYDYNTRSLHERSQLLTDYNFTSNIKMPDKDNFPKSNIDKVNTEEKLSVVCDNTIKEILKISMQQNCVKNNA